MLQELLAGLNWRTFSVGGHNRGNRSEASKGRQRTMADCDSPARIFCRACRLVYYRLQRAVWCFPLAPESRPNGTLVIKEGLGITRMRRRWLNPADLGGIPRDFIVAPF
jgi:hypothetical protein